MIRLSIFKLSRFTVGILDHPALEGSGMMKSDDQDAEGTKRLELESNLWLMLSILEVQVQGLMSSKLRRDFVLWMGVGLCPNPIFCSGTRQIRAYDDRRRSWLGWTNSSKHRSRSSTWPLAPRPRPESEASGIRAQGVWAEVRLSKEHAALLVETFKKGDFTVLWASKVKPDVPIPEHVLVTKFAPQRAVLGHPAVFGFVSHGGMNSVNEALAFGKPLAIMPFFGDQMMVAVVQRDLGVAVILDKTAVTPDELVAAIRKIATEPFRRRSQEIKALNEQRRDMARAVQVIVNQATGKFYMHIPPCPNILIRATPLFVALLVFAMYCNCCCCLSVRLQKPCRCCRSRSSSVPATTAGKKNN